MIQLAHQATLSEDVTGHRYQHDCVCVSAPSSLHEVVSRLCNSTNTTRKRTEVGTIIAHQWVESILVPTPCNRSLGYESFLSTTSPSVRCICTLFEPFLRQQGLGPNEDGRRYDVQRTTILDLGRASESSRPNS